LTWRVTDKERGREMVNAKRHPIYAHTFTTQIGVPNVKNGNQKIRLGEGGPPSTNARKRVDQVEKKENWVVPNLKKRGEGTKTKESAGFAGTLTLT